MVSSSVKKAKRKKKRGVPTTNQQRRWLTIYTFSTGPCTRCLAKQTVGKIIPGPSTSGYAAQLIVAKLILSEKRHQGKRSQTETQDKRNGRSNYQEQF